MSSHEESAGGRYRFEHSGFAFEFPHDEVARLKSLPEFELKEEPAVADEFLRFRAERWVENLQDAGVSPGPVEVRIDTHQRRARLCRGASLLFAAEL